MYKTCFDHFIADAYPTDDIVLSIPRSGVEIEPDMSIPRFKFVNYTTEEKLVVYSTGETGRIE